MGLLKALGESGAWEKTAVVVTYDEGGGFRDHVPPPRPDAYGCGTRIPALLIGPWARRGYIDPVSLISFCSCIDGDAIRPQSTAEP